MGKFDEAEKYCHHLLEKFAWCNSSLGVLYLELAEIASSKGDHGSSDQWHKKAIEVDKQTASGNFGNFVLEIATAFSEDCSQRKISLDIQNRISGD